MRGKIKKSRMTASAATRDTCWKSTIRTCLFYHSEADLARGVGRFSPVHHKEMEKSIMVTYKGTDKDMKCRDGFQYEIGKTYTDDGAIRCGDKGFHSCGAPMDVWSYFAPIDGNRFFSCEADGEIDRSDDFNPRPPRGGRRGKERWNGLA